MVWECVYHCPLYCSTHWVKVLVIARATLMVKCWSVLDKQFSAPCSAQQQQQQQGREQSEKRIWLLLLKKKRKKGPLILVWVSLGLPLGLEQISFSAEHGSFSRGALCPHPHFDMCHNWFQTWSGDTTGLLAWQMALRLRPGAWLPHYPHQALITWHLRMPRTWKQYSSLPDQIIYMAVFFDRLHFSTDVLIWQPGQRDHADGIGWWIEIK